MKTPRPNFFAMLAVLLLATVSCTAAAQDSGDALPSPLVTRAVLEARIAELQDATDFPDETRQRLVSLYRKSLTNLEAAQANADAATAYRQSAATAPAQVEALRATPAGTDANAPLADLGVPPDAPVEELKRRLQEERADLAAVRARHQDIVDRLAYQESRPGAVRQQLAAANDAREALYLMLTETPPEADAAQSPAAAQARRWELETRYRALSKEISMLDQELLSRAVRLELLAAKRDKQAASIDWIGARVAALETRILAAQQQAATAARVDAERMQRELVGTDPVLIDFAEANAELSQDIDALTRALRELDQARARIALLAERVDADYRDTRDVLNSGETSGELGAVLLQQLDALPDLHGIRQQRRQREAQIARANARSLHHRAETRRLGDIDASVAALQIAMQTAPTPAQQNRLQQLVTRRVDLLKHMLETEELYLAKARELDAAEDSLLEVAAEYETLLLEHLMWLRTEPPTGIRELLALPDQLDAMLATARTQRLGNAVLSALAASPVFWVGLLLTAALLWLRRSIGAGIAHIAASVGKPTTDSFGHTLHALGLTLLLALPSALPPAAAGWALLHGSARTGLTRGLGEPLLFTAALLFTLSLLAAICRPKGLAATHFRWPEPNLALLRTQTRRLAWLMIPAGLLLHLAQDLYPLQSGGTLPRLAGAVGFGALAWFLFRVFHPRHGVMAQLRNPGDYPLLMGAYWLWYPVLALYPLVLVGRALSGYLYTVTVEANNFLASLMLLLAVALLDALAMRWLLVVNRRLRYEAALERRRLALEAARAEQAEPVGEAAELHIDEPEADLSALSNTSRGLIRFCFGLITLLGLMLIWADLLPALRMLDQHAIWHVTVLVDGVAQQRPVTLWDLGLALLFAIGMVVLVQRLPALMEIVLLRRHAMSAADRYAVTALTRYAIGAAGILLVLGTLGASWTQLQWMAAALSVGIGFGLQEIVANFISGLIILFERPIRVGDTVTVGDTDGVVTKIRIRATTIRNFDRKELLVPNKEFITGRLLNWSLSDPITRILLVVGVAYGSDVDKAIAIMKGLAEDHAHVVSDPPPFVTFDTFGDNALTLTLRAYVDSIDVRMGTLTELNRAINRAFTEAGLSIAFPQRDVHLDTSAPLRVQLEERHGEQKDA